MGMTGKPSPNILVPQRILQQESRAPKTSYCSHTRKSHPTQKMPLKKVKTLTIYHMDTPPHHATPVKNCSDKFPIKKYLKNGASPKLPHKGLHTTKEPPKPPKYSQNTSLTLLQQNLTEFNMRVHDLILASKSGVHTQ